MPADHRQCVPAGPGAADIVFRSDDTPTIQGLIGSGLAYAVLPLLTLDEKIPTSPSFPSVPSPRPDGSGSHGIPSAGRR